MTVDVAQLAALSFTAPDARAERLARLAAEHLSPDAAARVLDLGCGSGLPALRLAALRPRADIVGVDLSAAGIAEATRRAEAGGAGRLRFAAADYLLWRAETPFDLIYSEGVLHLIPCPDAALAAKLADELAPGGVLALVTPHACLRNTLLIGLRRVLRALRGPRLDRLILALGRLLHPAASAAFLAERLPYMFMIPTRLDGVAWRAALTAAGLEPVSDRPWPQDSAAKLAHRAVVFRKPASPPVSSAASLRIPA